eukprot:7536379-Pyramimonas_sp.AAC.1
MRADRVARVQVHGHGFEVGPHAATGQLRLQISDALPQMGVGATASSAASTPTRSTRAALRWKAVGRDRVLEASALVDAALPAGLRRGPVPPWGAVLALAGLAPPRLS